MFTTRVRHTPDGQCVPSGQAANRCYHYEARVLVRARCTHVRAHTLLITAPHRASVRGRHPPVAPPLVGTEQPHTGSR